MKYIINDIYPIIVFVENKLISQTIDNSIQLLVPDLIVTTLNKEYRVKLTHLYNKGVIDNIYDFKENEVKKIFSLHQKYGIELAISDVSCIQMAIELSDSMIISDNQIMKRVCIGENITCNNYKYLMEQIRNDRMKKDNTRYLKIG